jgi:nicotinate phosphoribosyltransferase
MVKQTLTEKLDKGAGNGAEAGIENRTMLTDLYQLTMDAVYFENKNNGTATFDLFIRKLPEDWGFFIVNGVEDAIDYSTNISFKDPDIDHLRSMGLFKEDFLEHLKNFTFTGEISAIKEGTPISANTPILSVTAPREEVQLLETLLLNTINFQTMIASKANRIVQAAYPAAVIDFGLRRAQGMEASILGARAAYIGGAVGTSNVWVGKELGIPVRGTQAHSSIMSFDSEIEAFRAYSKTFGSKSTLLIDTYDTIQGAKNATIVAKEMERRGEKLDGVRLDSGDLAKLSVEVREILDREGLDYVKITASNDLNEYKIKDLKDRGARIDGYGVGTEMITGKPTAAISGVYKLVEDEHGPKIKLSPDKKSYPGRKQVYRIEKEGKYVNDVLALDGEEVEGKPLLERVVVNGERISQRRELNEIRRYCLSEVAKMPGHTLGVYAQSYEIKESEGLKSLVSRLTKYHKDEPLGKVPKQYGEGK